ncbi:MAG: NAD(P)/FAD-dependent oxidoreductase [Bacilli bacterium]|nr:NAD(P)/FAD-dependent oxidoreductase [Bacilli bacterium]
MTDVDLLIIGGGSAGMAAAIEAFNHGVKNILIVEKDKQLGGILNQCIHNGFGLTEFKEELTGPEYLSRFENQVETLGIKYLLNTLVLDVSKEKVVTLSNKSGITLLKARAIIFAVGCYERNAGAIQLPGDRPSGIITAGTAQKYLNIHGYLAGKKIVILGSGDIGLIMARRMTLEGAKVLCVSEIMPYSNGLNRNIAQCLNDYNIPLYLSHTVSKVIGKSRVEKVILSKVDENRNIIPNTEMEFDCDTLILSVGLVPYNSLLENMGCLMSSTKGPCVNENMMTNIPGVFACGNCLHVHDVVDFVTDEGRNAGIGASKFLLETFNETNSLKISPKNGISYVIPQYLDKNCNEKVTFKFRVRQPIKNAYVVIKSGDKEILKIFKPVLIPSEMVMIKVDAEKLNDLTEDILITLEGKDE